MLLIHIIRLLILLQDRLCPAEAYLTLFIRKINLSFSFLLFASSISADPIKVFQCIKATSDFQID